MRRFAQLVLLLTLGFLPGLPASTLRYGPELGEVADTDATNTPGNNPLYRFSAADGGLAGPPTASVEAVSDRVAPVVSALSYKSAGAPHDQASHRFGAGPVAVSFTTSEALTAIPALTLMTSGRQTMLVSVSRQRAAQ